MLIHPSIHQVLCDRATLYPLLQEQNNMIFLTWTLQLGCPSLASSSTIPFSINGDENRTAANTSKQLLCQALC